MSTLFLEVCSKGLIAQAKREGVWCLRCVWHRGGAGIRGRKNWGGGSNRQGLRGGGGRLVWV